jgi:Spy/CpxP family protein refolding chaperone
MNKRLIAALSVAGLLAAVAAPTMTVPAFAAKATAAGASKPGKGEKGPKGLTRVKNALEKLNLTPQQKPRVDEAVKTAEAELKKLPTGPGSDPKANKKDAKNILAGLKNKLSSILTPEQQKQFQALTAKKNKKPAA